MNWARAFFGIVIVSVGAVLLIGNLDMVDAGEIFRQWWPVVILVGGILALAANPRHWLVPVILILAGGAVLLRTTGVVDTVGVLLPVGLIVIGLLVIFGRLGSKTTTSDSFINSFNLFSGSSLASDSKHFEGGRIGAIFGGAEVDLRHAELAPDAALDVFTAFGGVEISVPRGWRVDIRGFPIFGGYENATGKDGLAPDAPSLRIDATMLFGGLEVKH